MSNHRYKYGRNLCSLANDRIGILSLIFPLFQSNGIFPFPQFYILWISWPLEVLSKCCFYSFLDSKTWTKDLQDGPVDQKMPTGYRVATVDICKVSYIMFFFEPRLRSQPSSCYSHSANRQSGFFSTDFSSTGKTIPSHIIALITAPNNAHVCQLTPFPHSI